MSDFRPLDPEIIKRHSAASKNKGAERVTDVPPGPDAMLFAAKDIDPDAAANAVKTARSTGVPAEMVLRNPGAAKPQFRPLDPEIIKRHAALSKVASTPEGAAMIKDDEELGTLSIAVNSWRRGQIGLGQQVESISASASKAYLDNLVKANEMADAGESEAAIRQLGLEAYNFSRLPKDKRRERLVALEMQADTSLSKSAGRLSAAHIMLKKYPQGSDMRRFGEAQSFGEQLKIAESNPLDMMMDVLPQSFVETAPWRVAAPLLGPAAIGAGSAASSYKSAFLENLQEQGVNIENPSELSIAMRDTDKFKKANDYAIGYSGGVGFLDMLSAGLAGRVRPFGTEVWDIKDRAPSLVTTTGDKAKNAASEFLVQGSAGAAGEAIGSGEINPGDMFIEFFADAVVGSATEPFAVNAAISSERRKEVRDAAMRAVSAAEYIKQIGDIAGNTKLAKRDPSTLAQVVQDMAEEAGAPTKVFVDAEDLNQVLEQSGLTIDQFADMVPSAAASIMEGYMAQTTIELPVGELLANVAGTPAEKALFQVARLTEDGQSAVEADSFLQSSYNDQLAAEADKIVSAMEADAPFRTSGENLRARVEADLIAAGSAPEVAKKQARLTESFFTVAARDWQAQDPEMTPEKLFARFYAEGRPMVQGPKAPARNVELTQQEEFPSGAQDVSTFDPNEPNILRQEDRRGGISRRAAPRGDRRVTDEQLFEKPVSKMTGDEKDAVIEEARVQLLVSELTGLGSKRAWARARSTSPQKFVASIDADGLAWVNDNMGHESGDALLSILGDAFAESGVTAYHISGDEFWMQGDDEGALHEALETARQKINAAVVSSDKWSVTGQSFSYGIAEDPKIAEEALQSEKAERQAAGLRAERKTRPAGARAAGEQGFVPPEAEGGADRAAGAGESSLRQDARGIYSPSTGDMRLLAKANLSTFIHESGHQYIDMTVKMAAMPDAPAAIKKRADDALAWLGIPQTPEISRTDAWLMMTLDEQRPYHEKWAETFEQYIFTGKAPSLEMADVFRAFKDWMKGVYLSMKRFASINNDAALDPEVTAIMDRMVATDEQIAMASASRSVVPLFSSKPAGMAIDEWIKYQNDLARQNGVAAETIDKARLGDMKWLRTSGGKFLKGLQQGAAEKRRQTRLEATRAILSKPIYQVRQLLEAKADKPARKVASKGLDTSVDSLGVAIAKLGGLNKDAAVSEWGLDPADWKNVGPFGQPVLRRNGGLLPGHMAEVLMEYGYLAPDAEGKADMNILADMLDQESRGNKKYSFEADWGVISGEDYQPIPQLEENPFAGARLDRGSVIQEFFSGPMQIAVGSIDHMMSKPDESGVNPAELAPLFGFGSANEMLVELMSSRPTQDAIDRLTDQMMIEKYGDIESPEAMADLVDKAIMSKAASRMVAREMKMVDASLGKTSDIVKAAREAAGNIIDNLKVGTIRPDKYKMAAARAGKDAIAAVGKNPSSAVIAKRGQILNIELFNLATDARQTVADTVEKMRDWFKPDDKLAKSRNMDMVVLARSIAGDYGLSTEKQASRAEDQINKIFKYNEKLAADLTSITAGLPPPKPYAELTFSEFQAVRTVAEAVWNMARHDKRMELNGQSVDLEIAESELLAELGTANIQSKAMLSTASDYDKAVGFFTGFAATLRRVESWADMVGPRTKELIYRPIIAAVTNARKYRGEKVKAYKELLATIKPRLSTEAIVAKELGAGPDGKGFRFSNGKVELLHAILHTGNESNKRKLLLGRGWATEDADGNMDTSRWDAFVARMIRTGVIGKQEMDFAQGVWDLMESMKPDAQAAHHKMFGYYFEEVTANPVVTPFGTYRGGYVPAIADRADPDVGAKVDADELLHAGNSFMFPTTGRGFTKARVEYNKPLELNLGALTSHIDKVSRFVHIEPVVRDVTKLLGRDAVKAAIEKRSPGAVGQMLNPWLQRSARQTVSTPGTKMDPMWQWFRSTAGASMMAGNIINTLQQTTGIVFAASKVPLPTLMRSLTNVSRHPLSANNRVKLLSPWMKDRMEGQSFEMRAQIETLLLGDGALDNAKKAKAFIDANAYFMQSFMQNRVDTVVWLAAYDNALKNGVEDAVAEADEAVRLTQGSFAPEDISAFEAGTPAARMFTQFYSYFGMLTNTMTTETKKAMAKGGFPTYAPRLAFIWFLVFPMTNFIAEMLAMGAPDDDDDEDGDGVIDEWLAMYIGASGRSLAAMVPYAGAGAQVIAGKFDDKPFNDRLSISPTVSYLDRALSGIGDIATGAATDEELKAKEVRSLLAVLGLTGIPTGQVGKTAGYLMELDAGNVEPETTFDLITGLARGR